MFNFYGIDAETCCWNNKAEHQHPHWHDRMQWAVPLSVAGQGQAKRLQPAVAAVSSPRAQGTRDMSMPHHRVYSAAVMDESFWMRER